MLFGFTFKNNVRHSNYLARLGHGLLWLCFSVLLLDCDHVNRNEPAYLVIDANRSYQYIDGFGGFGAQNVWWKEGPYYDQEFLDILIDDLGISILRDSLPLHFEPENDNADANVIDLSRFNLDQPSDNRVSTVREHFTYLQALHEKGLDKLIVSVWSAPLWMKHNQQAGNGLGRGNNSAPAYVDVITDGANVNQLRKEAYEEFAEYCVAYIRLLKQHTGIDLYALSVQNEPRFSQWYESAVLDPRAMTELISVVAKRFQQEAINTLIFAPEDVSFYQHIKAYVDAIMASPMAAERTAIIAMHGYKGDGIEPSSDDVKRALKFSALAKKYHKQLWMTETSGYESTTWQGGFALAKSIFSALKYAEVSAWLYWQLSESKDEGFIANGKKTSLYWASKHFYKHIRPGFKRIEVNTSNKQLQALGFLSPVNDAVVVLIINDGTEPAHVNLTKISGYQLQECWVSSAVAQYQHFSSCELNAVPKQGVLTVVFNKK